MSNDLRLLRGEVKDKLLFLDTLFDPWWMWYHRTQPSIFLPMLFDVYRTWEPAVDLASQCPFVLGEVVHAQRIGWRLNWYPSRRIDYLMSSCQLLFRESNNRKLWGFMEGVAAMKQWSTNQGTNKTFKWTRYGSFDSISNSPVGSWKMDRHQFEKPIFQWTLERVTCSSMTCRRLTIHDRRLTNALFSMQLATTLTTSTYLCHDDQGHLQQLHDNSGVSPPQSAVSCIRNSSLANLHTCSSMVPIRLLLWRVIFFTLPNSPSSIGTLLTSLLSFR